MIELIISSSALILIVITLRYILKGKISLRLQYALWLVVLVRLLMPISMGDSRISIMNVVEHSALYESAKQTFSETQVPSDVIRNSEMTAEEARKVGTGTIHEIQGYSVESGSGHLHTYIFTDSLATVLARVLKTLWLSGVAIIGLCLIISNLILAGRLRRARKRIYLDNCVLPVFEVETLPTPCLFGIFFPVIYITPDVYEDETKLRHVLAHEESHYRHKDHIWSVLRSLCIVVHWYNPLIWLAAKLSRRDGELACDEATIKRIGEGERIEYGRTLVGLTCERRSPMDLLSCATTMTDGKAGIRERITLIAQKPKMLISALIALLLVITVAVGCTFTGADNVVEETDPGTVRPSEEGTEHEIVRPTEEGTEPGNAQLTEEEIELVNKALSPLLFDDNGEVVGVNPISHFFKCFYDRPEDINLAEFLRYFPSETVTDEKEFDEIKAHVNFPFGEEATLDRMPVPTHKITAKSVNEFLLKYTGITLDDLSGVGAEDVIYLAEYDSYYNFTSDFAAGTFNCTHGEREGDVLRLYDSDRILLTLRKQDDDYLIVSFQLLGESPDYGQGKADTGTKTGSTKQNTVEPPLLTRDMHVGIGVICDYADSERLIFHGYFGLFVYDLELGEVTFSADLEKAVGTTIIQGSEGAAVRVSADGNTIQLYFRPERGEPIMSYFIDANTGNFEYDYYTPLEDYFTPTDEMDSRFSFGDLIELTYTDGSTTWLIFENWPWAE